jgi:hypothetical protein
MLLVERQRRARSCRRVRGGDERLILREVLLHRRATANPGIAFQLRSSCLVLGFVHNCAQSCAVDLPVYRGEHVTYDIRFHFFAAVLPQRAHIEHISELHFTFQDLLVGLV